MRKPISKESAQSPFLPKLRLSDWAGTVLDRWGLAPAKHHLKLIENLEDVGRGRVDRLMVLMPPGSAKSTFVSVLFPAWWFIRHPRSSIIAASHTADLAGHFGRQVRGLIAEHEQSLGYGLEPLSRAATRWRTTRGGEYFATGLRGPITGRRADLAIIDDPIKSFIEADRLSHRERVWNWYRSDLITRLKPKGRVIVVMTRWHEDDLAGRLLASSADEWRTLRLTALAEKQDILGRAEGEALWPEWEDAAALARKRQIVGERVWNALYQQSPRPMQGRLFKVSRIAVLDDDTALSGRAVRTWDLAATAADGSNNPDWTVGVKLLQDGSGRFVVTDMVRFRGGPHQVEQTIAATAGQDGRRVLIGLAEDPGQAGKTQILHLTRMLAGHMISATRETGSKRVRAMPLAAQIEAGNVAILRADWNSALLEELAEFPHGLKDDQVDALARAFNLLAEAPQPARRLAVPVLAR